MVELDQNVSQINLAICLIAFLIELPVIKWEEGERERGDQTLSLRIGNYNMSHECVSIPFGSLG